MPTSDADAVGVTTSCAAHVPPPLAPSIILVTARVRLPEVSVPTARSATPLLQAHSMPSPAVTVVAPPVHPKFVELEPIAMLVVPGVMVSVRLPDKVLHSTVDSIPNCAGKPNHSPLSSAWVAVPVSSVASSPEGAQAESEATRAREAREEKVFMGVFRGFASLLRCVDAGPLSTVRASDGGASFPVFFPALGLRRASSFVHDARYRPSLEPRLTPAQTAALDALTKPKLNFPAEFIEMARMIHAGGTTINGQPSQLIPFGVTKKGDRY